MKYNIPFIRPDFPGADDIAEDYRQILHSNWYTNFGPFERKFAHRIADYVGEGYYASTFSSATAGLLGSLIAILGKGDGTKYVLLPSFTFAAGAHAITWCGYKPLFIDIEESGLHMDLKVATRALEDPSYSASIAGILFCNAFGTGSFNIAAWEHLAERAKLPLIIDSAAGFGSLYDSNQKVGSAGRCEVFSFHATKPFGIGEGGAVVSRDKALIESLNSIQNFGFSQKGDAVQLGFNGKLQEINAAIGLRQFERIEGMLKKRRAVYGRYLSELNPDKFRFQINAEQASLCFATVIVKERGRRNEYSAKLQSAGVQVRTYYSPSIHKQTYFKHLKPYIPLIVTEKIDNLVLSLPNHDFMNPHDQALIIQLLNT